MKQFLFIHFVSLLTFSIVTAKPLPKHWHETKGFGTTTKGGLAGEVYKVTTLNSGGKGSLKDALSKGNRLIVFEIGGVFKTGMSPKNNTTVAGQTAPFPGVTCIGYLGLGGRDVVVSHVAFQYNGGGDACNVGGSNIVLDHSSVYWGRDETITFIGGNDVTLYKSICAEGLQFTGHDDGEHSKGIFMRSPGKTSIIGSMVVNNALRNPRVDRGTCFLGNHLVYNHGPGWDHQGPKIKSDKELAGCDQCFTKVVTGYQGIVTLVGSISLAGPESSPRAKYFLDGHNTTLTGYVKDNIIKDREGNDLFQANTEGEFTGGASGKAGAVTLKDTPPIWPEGYEPLPAHEALYEVLRTVGPHPGCRNRHAKRLVEDVAKGTGKIIDSPNEVGGYADYTPSQPRPLTNIPDGVEARQAWLDSMENEIAVDTLLDLSRLYSIVGSRSSDKLIGPPTPINNKINQRVEGFGLNIVQRRSRNKQLHVSFTLSTASTVSMNIFDLAGNRIIQQPGKLFIAGSNKIVVNVENLPVGLYVCRFQIGNTMINKTYNCF
ncbi:MAG: hypothetical protein PVI26_12155 [Chitinispirillia bacterium]|jgi:hypothetical protein